MFLFIFASCAKDGEVGPQGEQGIQGEQGVQGETGEDGTEAVVYTFSLTFTSTDWGEGFTGLGTYNSNTDAILVYIKGGTYYSLLPYTILYEPVPKNVLVYAEIDQTGLVWIETVWDDGSIGSPWTSDVTIAFKAVHIKGVSGNKSSIDYSDYEQVKKYYNLPD